jgi:hypothetical protein
MQNTWSQTFASGMVFDRCEGPFSPVEHNGFRRVQDRRGGMHNVRGQSCSNVTILHFQYLVLSLYTFD